jgi:hypothetical protein
VLSRGLKLEDSMKRRRYAGMTAWAPGLLLLALLACKKSRDQAPAPLASRAASAPVATAQNPQPPPGDAGPPPIERYGTEEQGAKGKAYVVVDELPVYPKADAKAEPLTKLPRDTPIERKARRQTFTLIEYPDKTRDTGHALGWVEDPQDPQNPVLKDVVVAKTTSSVSKPAPKTATKPTPSTGRVSRSRPGSMH